MQPQYGPPYYGNQGRPAAKPGIVPLRPISLGEIYDGAFQAIRTNPRVMLGVSAVVVTVITLISLASQSLAFEQIGVAISSLDAESPEQALGPLGSAIGAWTADAVLQTLAVGVLSGLLIVAVSRAVLGQTMSPGELWGKVRGRLLPLLGLNLLLLVAYTGIGLLVLAPALLGLLVSPFLAVGLALLFGLLAFLALVFVWVRWSMATPALLLEGLSVTASMRRSWSLVGSSFWRVLGILLLSLVIVVVVGGIISVPFSLVGTFFAEPVTTDPFAAFQLTLPQLLINGLGALIVGVLTYPFIAAVTSLLYIDLRMRREGLDVELARAAEAGGPA